MNEASNLANGVDHAFYFILGIDLLLFLGLTTAMLFFVFKYRRKKHPVATQIKENMWLEITWTGIPLILVLAMFYVGYIEYEPSKIVPKDAIKITAVAKMWEWQFVYPNGKESNKLILPIGKAVVLSLESKDVIHSLYIPAFRVKQDVVPGKQNYMWFTPTIKDTFDIFCAEYCGLRHSYMLSQTIVIDTNQYNTWVSQTEQKKSINDMPGFKILTDNGCLGCHSMEPLTLVGPSLKHLYNSKQIVVSDGKEREIKVDDEYIKSSILDPDKDIVKGFSKGLMQSYKTVLKDEDIKQITEFLKADAAK